MRPNPLIPIRTLMGDSLSGWSVVIAGRVRCVEQGHGSTDCRVHRSLLALRAGERKARPG